MAYSSIGEIRGMIDPRALSELLLDSAGREDEFIARGAIEEADALIDARLGERMSTPIVDAPPIVGKISALIAIDLLHRYRSIRSEVWADARAQAMEFLNQIASGERSLGLAADAQTIERTISESISSAARLFSRDLLKGM